MKIPKPLLVVAAFVVFGVTGSTPFPGPDGTERENTMELGAFSISLAVQDLSTSRAFYEKLGFTQLGGDEAQNYLILQNGTTVIGLFQGMFEQNILTFNPGWDHDGNPVGDFKDVRDIQRELKGQDVEIQTEADESSDGPASMVLVDPDGNMILLDQHVAKPDGA